MKQQALKDARLCESNLLVREIDSDWKTLTPAAPSLNKSPKPLPNTAELDSSHKIRNSQGSAKNKIGNLQPEGLELFILDLMKSLLGKKLCMLRLKPRNSRPLIPQIREYLLYPHLNGYKNQSDA